MTRIDVRTMARSPAMASQSEVRLFSNTLRLAHRACDIGEFDLAAAYLELCEALTRSESDQKQKQKNSNAVIAAYERVWRLRRQDFQ